MVRIHKTFVLTLDVLREKIIFQAIFPRDFADMESFFNFPYDQSNLLRPRKPSPGGALSSNGNDQSAHLRRVLRDVGAGQGMEPGPGQVRRL